MTFEVQNGAFSYTGEREVFRNIALQAGEGMTLSVLGPNGVGKTTLMKCILGLLKWGRGKTILDGKDLAEYSQKEIWQKIAYVPQAKNLVFPYSCEEMVLLGRSSYIGMFSVPGKEDRRIARKAMEQAGILHLAEKTCNQISGGELQLVLIARALASQPRILVLDEPETGLDFRNQLIVLDLVEKLCREDGMAAIINTHYPEHALRISQKTLLLQRNGTGRFGETREILTCENMKDAFGVNIAMCNECVGGKEYTTVIPVSIRKEE